MVLEILGHLDDPRDLVRSGQVCQSWKECSRDASLWRRLPLSHWEFGIWRFHPLEPLDLPSHLRLTSDEQPQPCQLFDNLSTSLLPAVTPMLCFKDCYEITKTEASSPFFQLGGSRCSWDFLGQQQNFHVSTSGNTSGISVCLVHPILCIFNNSFCNNIIQITLVSAGAQPEKSGPVLQLGLCSCSCLPLPSTPQTH